MTDYVVDPKNPPELSGVKGDVGWPGAPGGAGPPGIMVRMVLGMSYNGS